MYSCRRCFSWDSLSSLKLYFNQGFAKKGLAAASFVSVPAVKRNITVFDQHNFVSQIVLHIRYNRNDLESKLTKLAPRMSVNAITKIFHVLNFQRVLGLRFFDWVRSNFPKLRKNARFHSLMIDNFGRLDDYENMLLFLKKLTSENICLTYEAFGYLPALSSNESSLTEMINKALDILNQVKGSCRNSGVYSMIEMLSKWNLFEMAKYVMRISESKEAYFVLMIREKCKRNLVEDAFVLIEEMEAAGISPRIVVYNYILGNLCKQTRTDEASALFKRMKETCVHFDGITIEILINSACRLGKFSNVKLLLDQMTLEGIEPRLETHLCIIRAMFEKEEYEVVHKYVVDSCDVYKRCSNVMYSLLAKLCFKKDDIPKAYEVLVEMMRKRLKPDMYIYRETVKKMKEMQREDLARNLEFFHSGFV